MPANTNRSFVVRIWLEPHQMPQNSFEYRGMIEDVLSGERKYFVRFDEMIDFVLLQLAKDIQATKGLD
jgi:hypothetical protein